MAKTKICSKCGNTISVLSFASDTRARDGLQSQCRGCSTESQREWRRNNPERFKNSHRRTMRVVMARRRQSEMAAAGSWPTPSDWDNVVSEWGHRCSYCDVAGPLSIDHVVPLCRGGELGPENCIPACASCNSKKGAKGLREWLNDEDRYQFICDMKALELSLWDTNEKFLVLGLCGAQASPKSRQGT